MSSLPLGFHCFSLNKLFGVGVEKGGSDVSQLPGKTEQDPVAAKLGDADRTHQDDFCTPNAVRTEVARP